MGGGRGKQALVEFLGQEEYALTAKTITPISTRNTPRRVTQMGDGEDETPDLSRRREW